MAHAFIFDQVTLADLYAGAATRQLDVGSFIDDVASSTGMSRTGDQDADFVRALEAVRDEPDNADVDPGWRQLLWQLKRHPFIAHPACQVWNDLKQAVQRRREHRYSHVVQPIGVRTRMTSLRLPAAWDFKLMPPSPAVATGSPDAMIAKLCDAIAETVGGEEYLDPHRC
jgi:hypothetical protein